MSAGLGDEETARKRERGRGGRDGVSGKLKEAAKAVSRMAFDDSAELVDLRAHTRKMKNSHMHTRTSSRMCTRTHLQMRVRTHV